MAKVTLDALIPREDFEVKENSNPGKKKETISIEDIKVDSFHHSETKLTEQNPLADIAGKFGGKFWLETQSEIERSRKIDRLV